MDILSHGLWGGIIWGRKNKKSFWKSFFFGIGPDFLSFGVFFIMRIIQTVSNGSLNLRPGAPAIAEIPQYVHTLYNITHSFLIFALAFAIVWFFVKKPIWEMLAWPFHIFLDLFTHSAEFFPTPYIWPLRYTPIDGIPWSTPIIFFTNVFFLVVIYAVYWYRKKKGMPM